MIVQWVGQRCPGSHSALAWRLHLAKAPETRHDYSGMQSKVLDRT